MNLFNVRTFIQKCNILYPFLSFVYLNPSKFGVQDGPVLEKAIYGAVDPSTYLKVLKAASIAKPTLKAAFAACLPEENSQETSEEH